MHTKLLTDIVIVNWNAGNYLAACVNSIIHNDNEQLTGKIIIVDNHSSDDSLSKLPIHKKIIIIRNPDNKGFAKACNQGFQQCTSANTLLLNPDAQLLPDTLSLCTGYMQNHLDTDILGCSLLNDQGQVSVTCARFPKPYRYLSDALGLSKLFPQLFTPAVLMTDWNHSTSKEVNQVMGAFMFMKTSIFENYGYFDERFFVYYEELDFSKRVIDAGGKIFYNAAIKAIHSGEGTTQSVKAFRLYLSLQSRMKYARKHFGTFGLLTVALSTYIIEPFSRAAFCMLKGDFSGVKNIGQGYKMLIFGGPKDR